MGGVTDGHVDEPQVEEPELKLPSNHAVLSRPGVTFHFFVDSAEGAAMVLDAREIDARADAAEERLDAEEARTAA